MKVNFEILGKPMGKGRPRLGRYSVHTPARTANYETLVKWTFVDKYKDFEIMKKPIRATITAIFEVPKSYSNKQREKAIANVYYTHKPDCDNIAKIILDSLNKLAYQDDSQIASLIVIKMYGPKEKVIVDMEEI